MNSRDAIDLLDWKRRIAELYSQVRRAADPTDAWRVWRETRDELFATHPQSPLPSGQRHAFEGLRYFDHDPAFRVSAELEPRDAERFEIPTSGDEPMAFERVGRLTFDLPDGAAQLDAYWLTGYGGGLFVPFRDATSGDTTYGAGRYLLDTIKGADLGMDDDRLVLDFNFAYNPSCSYDDTWVCPLAPPANRIEIPITTGERL